MTNSRSRKKVTFGKRGNKFFDFGFLVIAILVLLLYFLLRFVAPATTMQIVHVITINSYLLVWFAIYGAIAYFVWTKMKGVLSFFLLALIGLFAVLHIAIAHGLGEYALYSQYAKNTVVLEQLPTPGNNSIKFIPENVANLQLQNTGKNSQVVLNKAEEAVIVSKNGESHTAYAGIFRPNDIETRFSGKTTISYIDAHTTDLTTKDVSFKIFPGGSIFSDPKRAFYAALPWYDGTSYNQGNEIVPIINEKDGSMLLALPVTTPKTVMVGVFPLSNIPIYTGAVVINPITGEYNYKTVAEIEKDDVLSRARLFPIDLAAKVAHSGRFAGQDNGIKIAKALLPSSMSAYANYVLAPDLENAGEWPSLYVSEENKPYLYFPFLPNSGSTAVTREVAIDAENGSIHVSNANVSAPKYVVESDIKQLLSSNQILSSTYGQFDEPIVLQVKGERYYIFPITSTKGNEVTAYAITNSQNGGTGRGVKTQFFKRPKEVLKWLENPIFTVQDLQAVFSGKTQNAVVSNPTADSRLEKIDQKVDAMRSEIKALTEAVKNLKK